MSAVIGKKIAIILSIFTLIIVLSVGCTFLMRPDQGPTVSDPDGIFLTMGDISITNQEMFERMKNQEGINHLLNYVDAQILSAFMDDLDEDEIAETILVMRFGTSDQDEIDALTEEEVNQRVREFRFSLILEGFDPEDDDEVERYARLSLARRYAFREAFLEGLEEDEDTSLIEEVLEFYENRYRGDGVGIRLVFQSATEFRNVMNHFNLIPNFESAGIAKYTGETPIEDVYEDDDLDFVPDVTAFLLDADEVLEYYIKIYNYLYQHRTPIDETLGRGDYDQLTEDFFLFDYHEMNLDPAVGRIGRYFFNTLEIADEDDVLDNDHYSFTAQTLVTAQQAQQNPSLQGLTNFRYMVYKLHEEELTPFDELDQEMQDDIEEQYITSMLTRASIRQHMTQRRAEEGFMLHDEYLRLAYRELYSPTGLTYYEEIDDKSIIAHLGDTAITTDALFEHMLNHVGAFHVTELFQQRYLIASSYYEEIFGTNRNFDRNRSEMMSNLKSVIRNAEAQFANSQESWFYTWDEFLYIASQFAYTTNNDFLTTLVVGELKPFMIVNNIDYDHALAFIDQLYENYFKLRADHILITLDFDENFNQDDLIEYLEELSPAELAEYEALRDALYQDLIAELTAEEDAKTMTQIVTEYRNALRGEDPEEDDYSPWAVYKNYGFQIMFQDLGLRTNANSFNYVDEFVDAMKVLYDRYLEDNTAEFLFADELVETIFGLHLIRGRKETGVDELVMPSAVFEGSDEYDAGWINASDIPTREQLELYADAFFRREVLREEVSIPASVDRAMREFFLPYQNRLYQNQEGVNLFADQLTIAMIQDANVTFPIANQRIQSFFLQILEVYDDLLWPDFD